MKKDTKDHTVKILNKQLELLKYMHEPHTTEELLEKTGYKTRQQINDLFRYAEDGIKIGNVRIPFIKQACSHKKFVSVGTKEFSDERIDEDRISEKNSVHPIILPLNLTQVSLLTNHLEKLIENDLDRHEYHKIIDMIDNQLSDYALKRLNRTSDDREVNWTKEERNWLYLEKTLYAGDKGTAGLTLSDSNGRSHRGYIEKKDNKWLFRDTDEDRCYVLNLEDHSLIPYTVE
ncbi:MAG: hypothetical protein Q4B60_09315 [Erysipelotrichaceae bacterium]|nr:hypothetical protein [Erysipelotrichaceae bacterium]